MEQNLRVLPGLYQECLHQVSPTGRRTNPTKVSGSRSKDCLDISVLDARHNILTILESWSGMVVDKLRTPAPPRTVVSLARFLTLHLHWLAGQAPAVDFADEIEALTGELRRTIDPEPNDLHTLIRQCVVDNCPGTISASAQRRAGAGSSITCSSGHSWEVREWLSLRKLMERQRKGVSA
ncbi:hypothetical protein A6P39_044810 (plasmid) [Streptomyces sp. FXJ1.172]|uniref:hypothetical protein n=1 Tax=Streptomyces sp. FXJ1.172 TaxID=710705 RepID=UPI0023DD42B0|nr:hypothetical protein [Streptomyces sp. FXJ1.172]WEP00979.1 hypothetical protein A6P39_044810 [Streptomyces sp. FXJ1.172]